MFVANYTLKSFVQKAAMVARLPIAYSHEHPYSGLKRRAHEQTLDFIVSDMPEALAFDIPRELLSYALSRATLEGLYAEFGVNQGGTINYIAKKKPDHMIHGFDSFEGLPEDWAGNSTFAGYFNCNGTLPKVAENVVLHKGWFKDTVPKFASNCPGPMAFLHVDCDLYSSTVTIFKALGDRIVPGTVIVFDEYFNYPNWTSHEHKAFREFMAASGKKFKYIGYSIQQVAVICV
jgi:hypothetical protein